MAKNAVPFTRVAVPLAAVGLATGLNAPAYAAPVPVEAIREAVDEAGYTLAS